MKYRTIEIMLTLFARVLVTALSLLAVEWLLPGISVDNFITAIIVAIVLGILHLTVKPLLVILTLPITILTLGLFMFVINAFMFLFADFFIEGFSIDGFLTALIASVIVSILSSIGNRFIP